MVRIKRKCDAKKAKGVTKVTRAEASSGGASQDVEAQLKELIAVMFRSCLQYGVEFNLSSTQPCVF